ncbi:nucleotide pyrophosphatase [Prolixibacteraceae bacterium JC049]|nr:nucleotide pyrophosphatase [Prolixibacteraceae bacterium JC049]
MKHICLLSLIIAAVLYGCNKPQPSAKRVIMLALDGISVEGLQTAQTPNLDQLLKEGVLSLKTRDVMPSVTLPNWTSILTGSGPEQHGVVNNGWQINKYTLPPVEKDAKGYYPSIFKVTKDQVPNIKTAFYYNWKNLIYPYNKKYFDEYSFEEKDGYEANYQKAFDFIVKHKTSPTLVYLYSVHTDHAGHRSGWMSADYIQSIEEADKAIGLFLDKLKQEKLYNSSHFMFLTDHGGGPKGHGGVTTEEMIVPWGITGPGIKKGFQLKSPNNTVNTSPVIAYLFNCKTPEAWIGKVPSSIFSNKN